MIILDHSVYPDLDLPPDELPTVEDEADYLHRVCTAWDFGVPPERSTIDLFSGWKDVFDRFPVKSSPAYHAFRRAFGWEPVDRLRHFGRAPFEILDGMEDRGDPCLDMV